MSFKPVISRHTVRQGVARFLFITDLSRLQALGVITKAVFEDINTWFESASTALPKFKLCRDLFCTACRAQFMTLLKTFLNATIAGDCEVPLESMEDARKMAKLLENAQRAAANHRVRGGSMAHVVVGSLAFDAETVDAAFEDTVDLESSQAGLDLCLGTSVIFPTATGERDGTAPLRLHFAWQSGALLVSARDDNVPSTSIEMPQDYHPIYRGLDDAPRSRKPLTVDVVSLSHALILNHRNFVVYTNSAWQAADSGIFTMRSPRQVACEALTRGVLCIMYVRDGMPEHSTNLAKALHLDRPQAVLGSR